MQDHMIVAFVQFYVRCRDAAQALSLAPAAKLTVEGWKLSVIQVSFLNKASFMQDPDLDLQCIESGIWFRILARKYGTGIVGHC